MSTKRKRGRKRSSRGHERVKTWLLLVFAFAVAAVAGYALLSSTPARVSSPPPETGSGADEAGTPSPPARAKGGAPPPPVHPEIREKSREKLLEILREAEDEGK